MQNQRMAIVLLCSVLTLASCETKKSNDPLKSRELASLKEDVIKIPVDPAIELGEYFDHFNNSIMQQFEVSPKRATVVTAKGGLKVTVNPSVLEKEDGTEAAGKIKVRIIELTNSEDLFRSNAATTSDGKLLASGGSYFIGMECDGQKLRIKNNKALQVDLPLIKKGEMELFYGERNGNNNMNWKKAGVSFQQQYTVNDVIDDMPDDVEYVPEVYTEFQPGKVFTSMESTVSYYKKNITLSQLVDTLNRVSPKVYLETISFWPKDLPKNQKLDTNFLIRTYGPMKQYILRTYKSKQAEEEALAKRKQMREEIRRTKLAVSEKKQLLKYYKPTEIVNLGWVNCDRYYDKEKTEVDLDLPIAFNNTRLEYFVIFRSFNGLMTDHIDHYGQGRAVLFNMPVGEKVTLIAFAKTNGTLYQVKHDFTIERNKKIAPEFKSVSTEEMNDIFGKNVRI